MNEVQFRRDGYARPVDGRHGEERGNGWYVFPLDERRLQAYPGVLEPATWTSAQLSRWFNLSQYDWRLVSPEGAVLAKMLASSYRRKAS